MLVKHYVLHNQEIDLENVEIVDRSLTWRQRLFLEAWHSVRDKNSINYGGPQLSHQNKMITAITNRSHQIQIAQSIVSTMLTANSNRSQQIQIAHSELQIAHSKLQIAHSKFKSPTANSNRSQQIKVAHSRFKLLISNYKPLTLLGVFGYLQPAVQLV